MKEPVVFFGTGPVAAASLRLLSKWARVEAVITKPQPPHHKGSFPVLDAAEQLQLRVLTVSNKKELDELMERRPVNSRLGVLVDFGIIVSQQVIDYFPIGIVNSHFSLLPEWRGADPITFSILSGQKRTGVSLMLLTAGLDEGPILATEFYDLPPGITTPQLTEQLITISDAALRNVLPLYVAGTARAMDQLAIAARLPDYPNTPTYSRRLTKEDGILDFNKPAEQLEREIRAFIGWPASRTTLAGKEVIIVQAHVAANGETAEPGRAIVRGKELCIQTADGLLAIDKLKPAGKAEMSAAAFLNGHGRNL